MTFGIIGQDEGVENAEPSAKGARTQKVPPSMRLLVEVAAQGIDEAGETFRPGPDWPLVKGRRWAGKA
jgi:hypothetical protein